MPDNPLEILSKFFSEGLHNSINQVQHFVFRKQPESRNKGQSHQALVSPTASTSSQVSKEQLGRSTWTLLHTVAAQYPAKPDKRQRKDVEALIDVLTRTYPCAQCSSHFQDIVRQRPPQTASGHDLQQWMCEVHNLVNASIDKPQFNCKFVGARWTTCDEDLEGACAIQPQASTKKTITSD